MMSSIFHRISVRKFEDRPIEKEKIVQVLKAGMQAPSACNQQPWEFYVVTEDTGIVYCNPIFQMCSRGTGRNCTSISDRRISCTVLCRDRPFHCTAEYLAGDR